MISIKKYEHVYGIKNLKNSEYIDKNTIIYSPNGVMKSSFTDGLLDISLDTNPCDVFNNIAASYIIDNNGTSISESTTPKHLDLVIFKGEDMSESIFTDKDIAKIVVSPTLKKKYKSKMSLIENTIDEMKNILATQVLGEKKDAKNTKINEFLLQFTGESDLERITDLLSKPHDEINEDCSTISFSSLYNPKTEPILNDNSFIEKCEEFKNFKNAEFDKKIFNDQFGITQLENTNKSLIKNKYYEAGHKLSMNEKTLDKSGVETLIKKSIKSAYGSDDIKNSFIAAKKVLTANANSREVVNTITNNIWLLEKLSTPSKFKIDLIFDKLTEFSEILENFKIEINNTKKEIAKIYDETKQTESVWNVVIKKYNQRFNNKYFDIIIKNQVNAIIGIEEPTFTKVLKNTNEEITDNIFTRFSSGEQNAIFILYFLFEIELKNIEGIPYTIVADDIVDSFDYKNKYAILEYLSELSLKDKVQLIILTHNFDFYRSSCMVLGCNLDSRLFGYIDTNDDVSLFKADSQNYESFKLFEVWKAKDNTSSLITLIPFLRNLVELRDGIKSDNYILLCNYLHYNLKTSSLKLSDLNDIYEDNNIIHTNASSQNHYWNLLILEVKSIVTPVVESDISKKILLGLFIRLATDYLLLRKYKENNNGEEPSIPDCSNWTKQLKKLALNYLTNGEKSLFDRAQIAAPSFIHVNSFMYEPLIDIGSEKLLQIANELLEENTL